MCVTRRVMKMNHTCIDHVTSNHLASNHLSFLTYKCPQALAWGATDETWLPSSTLDWLENKLCFELLIYGTCALCRGSSWPGLTPPPPSNHYRFLAIAIPCRPYVHDAVSGGAQPHSWVSLFFPDPPTSRSHFLRAGLSTLFQDCLL